MRAVTFQGAKDIQVKNVEAPKIEKDDDIIIRITSTAICGSDLHIYAGSIMTRPGYVIGHEPMGIVEETGPAVTKVKKGDRVVIPFNVACGECWYCTHDMESQCEHPESNPTPGTDFGGYFGYTEMFGNHPGGQAEYMRVPFGNFLPFVIPESAEVPDEAVLFMSDVLPTAYWSVLNSGVKKGDTVIVLGCGPIGLMTQKFAWMMGAKRVIGVDTVPYRLAKAREMNKVETVTYRDSNETGDYLKELTSGGADVVIDCVGMDGEKTVPEKVQHKMKIHGGSLTALRTAHRAVRRFGTVQLTGVYGLWYNAFPLGRFFERNVTIKTGQAPVPHLMPDLFKMITEHKIDPTEIISHIVPLEEAPIAYKTFYEHGDECTKVVLKP
ncbi:Formaldehyde dismutase [Bhargavaea cecembensis DSE10]|uniref:Formaldehyde dismutase n=1 Tax=Bhargavaea cecembensis DSE10 TaxID=1235279 RepID=M7NJ03_9BACL|nr:zinc-dependent alcohol dehydrogenase [Bhargavaea cecembensis]EMR07126.1 Formaldehyde dismutase [Bhargavaea cecembensis DSE10]